MTMTSAQIVTASMRRLTLLTPDESPTANQAASGLSALNAMYAGLTADGINVTPDLPLAVAYEEGLVAMLAVRLAEDYGKTPGPILAMDAQRGRSRLEAAYIVAPATTFDSALVLMPSRRYVSLTSTVAWAHSTAYVLGDRVTNAGNVYECTTAGTSSASGGPTTTAASITDGTVVWQYIEAVN